MAKINAFAFYDWKTFHIGKTPGTRVGPCGCYRTLAVKCRREKSASVKKNIEIGKKSIFLYIFLLVGSKYEYLSNINFLGIS